MVLFHEIFTCFQLLRDMKRQLAELLHDLGFLGSRSPKDHAANINSGQSLYYDNAPIQYTVLLMAVKTVIFR